MSYTFTQINDKLTKFIQNNTKPGHYKLDNIIKFMDNLGNPQNELNIIHIAGTSGKTSTAYYIATLLNKAGMKVGLTISPHIHNINERYLINQKLLPEKYFCKQFSEFINIVDESNIKLSYFEVLVAFSFWEFNNQKVDYAVIEVGLGGLLDCTNIISNPNKISVITDIGIDHVKFLGNTIEKIAKQKAGIIKPENEVFLNIQNKNIVNVIEHTCKVNNSVIHIIDPYKNDHSIKDFPDFQIRNFSLAFSVFNHIVKRDNLNPINSRKIQNAMQITIPGRMQIVKINNKTIILDGSHNPQKIESLVKAIEINYPNTQIDIIAGFKSNTEDINECLSNLRLLSNKINLTDFKFGKTNKGKSLDTSLLKNICDKLGFKTIKTFNDPNSALKELLENKSNNVILITGTFFLLSAIEINI